MKTIYESACNRTLHQLCQRKVSIVTSYLFSICNQCEQRSPRPLSSDKNLVKIVKSGTRNDFIWKGKQQRHYCFIQGRRPPHVPNQIWHLIFSKWANRLNCVQTILFVPRPPSTFLLQIHVRKEGEKRTQINVPNIYIFFHSSQFALPRLWTLVFSPHLP